MDFIVESESGCLPNMIIIVEDNIFLNLHEMSIKRAIPNEDASSAGRQEYYRKIDFSRRKQAIWTFHVTVENK